MIIPSFLRGKKVVVFGLARSGVAALTSLSKAGAISYAADDGQGKLDNIAKLNLENVICEDINAIDWDEVTYLVLSPGVPLTHPKPHQVVVLAKAHNVKIIVDVELLYLTCPKATYIGITGTNGKSTTTSLIAHIIKESGRKVIVGGNLGYPVMGFEPLDEDGVYVIEMSSYQLDLIDKLHFKVAVFLNITKDHLDRHGDMKGYVAAKMRIFNNMGQDDIAVIAKDDDYCRDIITKLNSQKKIGRVIEVSSHDNEAGISVISEILEDRVSSQSLLEFDLGQLRYLPGTHNGQNIAASYAAAVAVNVDPGVIIKAIKSFQGLRHRIQYLGKIGNAIFVNDSKATNADAASKSLSCYDNIYWIVGGLPKEGGIDSLEPYFSKVKKAYLVGQAANDFAKALAGKVAYEISGDLQKAFQHAVSDTKGSNDAVVLLAPACASFDQWASFEARGDAFCNYFEEFQKEMGK